MPHSPRFEFGPFQLDLNDRLLTRAGEVISLRPKATEILVRLVTNAGQLIKRDELLKEVWPDTFVEESNLSQPSSRSEKHSGMTAANLDT